ncbi:hypothetical protein HS1genome_1741 [Sulfodiicoccus acidiphilus]|uniref:Type I-B CRISPR-associated protein Cas8b/Csh1 n=1 Tax=Sulfodiicoccus acidiphilus TaxID=1670455 RepID=A0A348B5A0_9CREN|nr:TM1802 family CRISPR-associated protein [Sulfodiicoccus acidiphilus]BBD73352.1 hypothetical protein HS1genome_1741 [Sulfodiicoccus acidiphilus]GGT88903.1 hypothetical protein GCM10007116_03400 [Sulfodiicoccus acidiphilus]
MFAALREIGRLGSEESHEKLPIKELKDNEGSLCYVVFDDDSKTVSLERVELYEDVERDLAFMGNYGGQKDQLGVTTNQFKYVLGFDEEGKAVKREKKFALQVISQRLKGTELGNIVDSVLSWYTPDPDKFKDVFEKVRNSKDCKLYTVKILHNGREVILAKEKEYRSLLSASGETVEGTCQICGSNQVLENPDYPNGSILKIFITDKKGFLPHLFEDNVTLAHSVCPSCRSLLVLGSNYVEQRLVSSMGAINAYIIPDLPPRGLEQFLKLYEPSLEGFLLKSLEDVRNAEKEVDDAARDLSVEPRLTILFGKRQQAKFKVWRVIPEVSYLRLIAVVKTFNRSASLLRFSWSPSFKDLYASLPVRETRDGVDPRYFLDFFEAIVLDYPLDPSFVYKAFTESLRCRRYETCENRETMRRSLEDLVLLQHIFIYSMGLLGLMSVSSALPRESDRSRAGEIAESMGLKGGRKGLYLLGYLTAQVGKEQAKKEDKRKAILDRIDFEGMDYEDVKVYANRLAESLRDYNVLQYNEAELGEALRLIEEDSGSLRNPQENVFLILLGYSYTTKQILESTSHRE